MISKSQLVAVERILKGALEDGKTLMNPDPVIEELMIEVKSDSETEKHGGLTETPVLEEWKDERNLKGADDREYDLKNLDFEATISVHRNAIKYDKLGAVIRNTQMLGQRAAEHWQRILKVRMTEGAATTGPAGACYDGVAFFSASHSEKDSGTQSNINSSGGGTTVALLEADFKSAKGAMLGLKDAEGQQIRNNTPGLKWIVGAPPALHSNFEDLQNAAMLSNSTNTLRGAFDLFMGTILGDNDANDWNLHETSLRKPYVKQISGEVESLMLGKDSESGFMRKIYHFGVDVSGNVGYLFWQSAYKVVNS